ncbi:pyridoxal phosphate-dependent transferase, partial [Jimgerdemannia flammicorona]
RLIQESIERGETPFFVNATAGTTVLVGLTHLYCSRKGLINRSVDLEPQGAFDPIRALSAVAKNYNCWLHVDGSWGGTVAFSENVMKEKDWLDGSELADTFTMNPHKLLGVPLQCSLLLTPHSGHHLFSTTNSLHASYLFHGNPHDLGDGTMGCGRRPDAAKLFLGWKWYGRAGYGARVDHALAAATELTDLVRTKAEDGKGFELVVDPTPFLQVCFWFIPPALRAKMGEKRVKAGEVYVETVSRITKVIHAKVNESGEFLIEYAPLSGIPCFFRVVLNAPTVQKGHLERLVERIEEVGNRIEWAKEELGI